MNYDALRMALTPGARLGPYEILAPLGVGGMGEVYRARDTRLDRIVALKTLPAEWSRDPERRGRFEREAKAISALSHPHICTLHDVGDHNGIQYLVMELLEGRSLAAQLKERTDADCGRSRLLDANIAGALEKAHRSGIVHRDRNPANVMLTPSGAKLLDFGLAKQQPVGTTIIDGATETGHVTVQGQILGTLQYMAPEQVEGRDVDARTDVFAFGALIYEMATGRPAFEGASQASVIGAILQTTPPPIAQVTPGLPAALDRLVSVCLAKNPDDRWSSAHDVLLRLRDISDGPPPGSHRQSIDARGEKRSHGRRR